jgi:hypothetical protein
VAIVIDAGVEVLLYALAAAASALVLSATFVAIRSERPRTNAIAFLSGFLAGTVIACGLGLALGQAAVGRLDSHETLKAAATLILGVALLVVGLRARRTPPTSEVRSSRATAILAGLRNVGPAASTSMAGLLGFGGPKRLVLTCLAMASVTEAGLRGVVDVTLVAIYIAVSTLTVWLPVGVVLVAGDRADATFARAQGWLSAHAGALRVWLSLGIGGALVADGLVRLFF